MRSLYLDVFGKTKLEKPPVWIMRQAGRYLPEYRATRSKFENFMDMCRNADACCEVALQPLARYDLDAAIVFSDILTIPEALGLDLKFVKDVGPIFADTIKTQQDVDSLVDIDIAIHKLSYVYDAVKTTKKAVNVPLIGFTGSPWTLAAYMVEGQGSKQFAKLRKLMYSSPSVMHSLLQKLSDITIIYLIEQIKAGADSLMIFDTWGGILPLDKYCDFSLNYMEQISSGVKRHYPNIPIVLFTKGGSNFYSKYSNLSCNGVGVDWSVTLNEARSRLGNGLVIQGNLDPAFLYGDKASIIKTTSEAMKFIQQDTVNNYIVNLGHGIYPDINPDMVKVMIDTIRKF